VAGGGAAGSIQRRRIGAELRELRKKANLTLDEVARRFDWSVSKASRMELGRVPISPRDVRDLLDLYGLADDERRDAMVEAARGGRERDWWHEYDDLIGRQFAIYLGFEKDATSVRNYESLLIPGLLQTPEYAREIFRAAWPAERPDDHERRVAARMQRQTLLTRPAPPEVCVILDEAALHRGVGGPDVMHVQLVKLVQASYRRNITVQVVPFGAGAYPAMQGGFVVLGFGIDDPEVAFVDGYTREQHIEDAAEARRYAYAFDRLSEQALSPEDSRELIARVSQRTRSIQAPLVD
jgi:transcriptional regulator with XRE-family HTH domain